MASGVQNVSMTPNALAFVVLAVAVGGGYAAYRVTHRLMRGPAVPRSGVLIVLAWTGLAGALPYLVFVIGVGYAQGHGQLTGFSRLILGLLPLLLLSTIVVSVIYALRHFSRHVKTQFNTDGLEALLEQVERESNGKGETPSS